MRAGQAGGAPAADPTQQGALWRGLRRVLRHRGAMVGGTIVLALVLVALLAPVLSPYDPYKNDLARIARPPGPGHLLGTDELGRDMLTRLMYGARLSLLVGVTSVGLALVAGTAVGAVSGYLGGWLDLLTMRVIDIMLAFPSTLLAIAITAILGPSLTNAVVAVAIVNVPIYARLVRSSVLSIRELEYVEAARAAGMPTARVIWRHVLPGALAPLIVQSTMSIGSAILEVAGLSFLGLGAAPPAAEWGAMLSRAREFLQTAPWVVTFPGMAIMLAVLGFNLLGDGLRDLLDPRLRHRG
ncbi:nickel transporter permease [Caldinitratiruptor microaerophilus]|uniref:nickel transporter permease n=1 Tax=Caldinitratiruptor microaerophilus TaxID=671077 RepID=UPI002232B013|nr:nickel transporter permease [Caldinitratiruptor microaerophilus]